MLKNKDINVKILAQFMPMLIQQKFKMVDTSAVEVILFQVTGLCLVLLID